MTQASIVHDVTDATFQQAVIARSRELPVVVDFWAPWCGPCRVLGPALEKVAAEFAGDIELVKLNTDENPRTATQYRIQGIPAVKAFRNGQVVTEFTGAIPEVQVRAFFQRLAPTPAQKAAREAERLAGGGETAAAEQQFRTILATSPNNPDAVVGLATILLDRSETAAAGELLERAPADRRAKVLRHRLFLEGFASRHRDENLEAEATAHPADPRARYRWGVLLAAEGHYERALDELLESVRLDRTFAEGAARQAMLAVFDILGDSSLAREYQRRFSTLLF